MAIDAMPGVLTWQNGSDAIVAVYRSYVGLLSDRLGVLMRRLSATDAELAVNLSAQMQGASDEAFIRVLTAPETSFRLLGHGDASDSMRGEFILAAFEAESMREGRGVALQEQTWTALGDLCFGPGGRRLTGWRLKGVMPIDLGSPLARATAVGEMELDGERLEFEPFSDDEVTLVLRRLDTAVDGISATSSQLLVFATTFTRVLVCLKDRVAADSFASGSTGQYIGRSFLANPHLPNVDETAVAEGLVHESIHGLLYMQERQERWVSDQLYRTDTKIVSPWTGSPLRVRPYLQACFVWYGLLQFWSLAFAAASFDPVRVRARLVTATQGYLHGPLGSPLESFAGEISPELLQTIQTMQDHVVDSVAETAPALLETSGVSDGLRLGDLPSTRAE